MGLRITLSQVTILLATMAILAFMGGVITGSNSTEARLTKPDNIALCKSTDVLDGALWKIELDRPLDQQDCHESLNFPDKILCKRQVTLECDKP